MLQLLQPLGAIVSMQLRAVAVVRLVLSQYSILAGILAAQLGIGSCFHSSRPPALLPLVPPALRPSPHALTHSTRPSCW